MLEEEFGAKVDDVFEWFDEVPVASGSVGQVHRARLRNGGRKVTCCLVHVFYNIEEMLIRWNCS